MRFSHWFLPVVAVFSSTICRAGGGSVDLHAHLFMKEGMGWMFHGDFTSPIQAGSWNDLWSSHANQDSLKASGNAIVVVALYAHPIFIGVDTVRQSIRRQITQAEAFVKANPGWVIAREPAEARKALASGKQVLVLGLEGAWGTIENDDDLKEFIDEKGIRVVTLLHLTDDEFGGAAFLPGIRGFSTPEAFLWQLFAPLHDDGGVRINRNGLTDRGEEITRKLLARHVWIDLSHSPDRALDKLEPLIEAAGQPLLHTHTVLRRYHQAERGISDAHLARVAKSGGMIGLMPTEQMLAGTPVEGTPSCDKSLLSAMARQFKEMAAVVGSDAVVLGSDTNAPVPGIAPTCETGTSLDQKGFVDLAQTGDLWMALRKRGAPVPVPLSKQAEKFLKDWERVRP